MDKVIAVLIGVVVVASVVAGVGALRVANDGRVQTVVQQMVSK